MMKKLAGNNITKGQAAVELAIFGSIILVAFSILLMYGQRLDSQQQVKMEAFRRALQKAYERNGSVSYTLKKESRAVNLFGGFGQGQPSTVGSTALVMWQKGASGQQGTDRPAESFSYYAINDNEIGGESDGTGLKRYPKLQTTTTGDTSFEIYTPVSVWSEEQVRTEVYNATTKKEEKEKSGGRIINTKASDLKDTIKVTLHTRIDKSQDKTPWNNSIPLPEYVYEKGNREGLPFWYEHEGKNKTVQPISPVSLGAYAREDKITDAAGNEFTINRIGYDTNKVDTTIHRERKWQTDN